jgi:hypothetical protein
MPRKKHEKMAGPTTVILPKKKPAKKAAAKVKRHRGLTNAELRELMKKNKPPQSWYEEDHTGLC